MLILFSCNGWNSPGTLRGWWPTKSTGLARQVSMVVICQSSFQLTSIVDVLKPKRSGLSCSLWMRTRFPSLLMLWISLMSHLQAEYASAEKSQKIDCWQLTLSWRSYFSYANLYVIKRHSAWRAKVQWKFSFVDFSQKKKANSSQKARAKQLASVRIKKLGKLHYRREEKIEPLVIWITNSLHEELEI